MRTLARPILSAPCQLLSTSRAMSSLTAGCLLPAPHGNAIAKENLDREHQSYLLPGIASAVCFRQLYDVIDNGSGGTDTCLALEWLDTTLAQVNYQPDIHTYRLVKVLLKAAVTSCMVLEAQNHMNTDYKSANILLSNIDSLHVTAKVGDLGLVFPSGHRINAQPFAMRAPEVFLGEACTTPSQIWAIAAMLLCWIKPGILGSSDSPHFLVNEAWSMAKIKRLFPSWNLPTPDNVEAHSLQTIIKVATRMSQEELAMLIVSRFEHEIKGLEIPQELGDILRLMLVTDPTKRPNASTVLVSSQFRAFEDFVNSLLPK